MFRIAGLTDAGLPQRRPNASNPPNAAEGRARNKAAHKARKADADRNDSAPVVHEAGVMMVTGSHRPDELNVWVVGNGDHSA